MPFHFFPFLPSLMNTCLKGRAIKRASRVTGRVVHLEEVTDPSVGTKAWADFQGR